MNGPSDLPDHEELATWKEIASYLGVTTRTAQLWAERRGMPVHRMPGGQGRVFAYRSELDAWKTSTEIGQNAIEKSRKVLNVLRYRWVFALAVFAVISIVARAWMLESYRVPSAYRIDSNTLYVLDQDGREMFRKTFSLPLSSLAYPPARSIHQETEQMRFEDLDSDGDKEILFVHRPANPVGEVLYCFDRTGAELWSFAPGRQVSSAAKTFMPPFWMRQFTVVQTIGGKKNIAVTSSDMHSFPNQVALLDARNGRPVREYWHSGALLHIAAADLDHDGSDELYLTGIHNASSRATLVVLDPRTMDGASSEREGRYQLAGFRKGTEKARVFFPRTEMNGLFEPYGTPHSLAIMNGEIAVEIIEYQGRTGAEQRTFYRLGSDLRLLSAVFGDVTRAFHGQLFREGKVRLVPEQAEAALTSEYEVQR